MDHFWGDVKGDPDQALPLVRAELRDAPQGSFFLMDGSELLLSISETPEDKQLAADALARTDSRDTQSGEYFFTVHRLACGGANTTAAALHILDDPGFLVAVPQHAMALNQSMAVMYVLLSMKDDIWIKPAEERFANEKDEKAKLALVSAFSDAQTDEADAELRRIALDASQPEAVRKEAQRSLDEAKSSKNWKAKIKATIAEIRERRRERLRNVSDEALYDVQWMTRQIAQLRAKGKS